MRIEIKFAEIHHPLFLAGVNLGQRFGEGQVKGDTTKLYYDMKLQCLIVTYKGAASMVPLPTIASMQPKDPSVLFPVQDKIVKPPIKAGKDSIDA